MKLIDIYNKLFYKKDKIIRVGDKEFHFHENGNLKSIGNYKNGKVHGEWVFFHENGNLEWVGNFKNGEFISEQWFTSIRYL
ncbi:MAG: hypothetical protein MI923_18085 [Phycisphaerales bacterium]|nr:hypothetical protein [Phycisphaerales bacterium]